MRLEASYWLYKDKDSSYGALLTSLLIGCEKGFVQHFYGLDVLKCQDVMGCRSSITLFKNKHDGNATLLLLYFLEPTQLAKMCCHKLGDK